MTRVLGSRQQPGAFFFLEHKTFSDFFLDDFRQLFGKALAKTASALPLLPQRRRSPSSLQKAIINKSPNTKFKVLPQAWSLDFVADQLTDGRRFRALTIVDVFTRESLAIEVGQALKGTDVVAVLNQIRVERGAPKMLFCDNGSEFTSQIMDLWAYQNGVRIDFSRPVKPTDNAYIETFNGTLRAECLDAHWFETVMEAKESIEAWRKEYNESRPHRALGERTPNEFANEVAASRSFIGLQADGTSIF